MIVQRWSSAHAQALRANFQLLHLRIAEPLECIEPAPLQPPFWPDAPSLGGNHGRPAWVRALSGRAMRCVWFHQQTRARAVYLGGELKWGQVDVAVFYIPRNRLFVAIIGTVCS